MQLANLLPHVPGCFFSTLQLCCLCSVIYTALFSLKCWKWMVASSACALGCHDATATPQQVKSQCNRNLNAVTAFLLQLCRSSTLQSSSFILLSTCAPESGEEHQAASSALLLKHTLLPTLMVSGKILSNACNTLQLCN